MKMEPIAELQRIAEALETIAIELREIIEIKVKEISD